MKFKVFRFIFVVAINLFVLSFLKQFQTAFCNCFLQESKIYYRHYHSIVYIVSILLFYLIIDLIDNPIMCNNSLFRGDTTKWGHI